jgi:site-specific recombinase XerC
VQAWFGQIKQRSPATQLAYQRAIERLVLWAVHEKRLALSSLSTEDLLEFRAFLASPPPHWAQIPGAERAKFSAEWRPLRGPQKDKSLDQTFAAVGAMFGAWRKADYISANPADQVVGSTRKNLSMDVMRSFSDQHLAVIGRTFDKLKDGPAKRRLAAILRLLENAGLRREEVEKARWGHLFQARLDNKQTDQWALKVVGKGNREREVPINRRTFEALTAHREDRIALAASGKLARFANVKPENMPLIGVIDTKWIQTQSVKLAKAAQLPVATQAFGERRWGPICIRYLRCAEVFLQALRDRGWRTSHRPTRGVLQGIDTLAAPYVRAPRHAGYRARLGGDAVAAGAQGHQHHSDLCEGGSGCAGGGGGED